MWQLQSKTLFAFLLAPECIVDICFKRCKFCSLNSLGELAYVLEWIANYGEKETNLNNTPGANSIIKIYFDGKGAKDEARAFFALLTPGNIENIYIFIYFFVYILYYFLLFII